MASMQKIYRWTLLSSLPIGASGCPGDGTPQTESQGESGTSAAAAASSSTEGTASSEPTGGASAVTTTASWSSGSSSGATTTPASSSSTAAQPTTSTASTSNSETDGTTLTTGGNELCEQFIVHQGDLIVTDATDLDELTCIVEITGKLRIEGTTSLSSFPQLGNLKTVGDEVLIGGNAALTDVHGLAGLTEVTGAWSRLTLYQNPALVDITGLHALKVVDAIVIMDCDALSSLAGIEGAIVGVKQKASWLALIDLDALESLDSLAALADFSATLKIRGCDKLTDISMLELVLDPQGTFLLEVSDNPALVDLTGLEAIAHATEVQIINNDSLKDLSGLDSLEATTAKFIIQGNEKLQDLNGLGKLEKVEYLAVHNNAQLIDLGGLDSLKTVTLALLVGSCTEGGNAALSNLHGLESVETIVGLGVDSNTSMTSLMGLDQLTSLALLFVRNNPGVSSVEAKALATTFMAAPTICNNAGPPEDCPCAP